MSVFEPRFECSLFELFRSAGPPRAARPLAARLAAKYLRIDRRAPARVEKNARNKTRQSHLLHTHDNLLGFFRYDALFPNDFLCILKFLGC